MRRTHVCPKCHRNKSLLIETVADTGELATEVRELRIARLVVGESWTGTPKHDSAGKLGAAVCRACGYTELHVHDPLSIPVDGVHVREVTGPAQDGAYR